MSAPLRSRPLRRSLMAAVMGIVALALLADRAYEYAVVMPRQIEAQYAEHLQNQSYALGRDFSALLLSRDIASLRLVVSSRAATPAIRRLIVSDQDGTILASTHPGDEGQRLGAVLADFNLLAFSEAQGRNRLVQRLAADRMSLSGYAPVQLPPDAGELRAARRGVLYMELDLRTPKAASWNNLLNAESLLRWGIACLFAAVLIHLLLRAQLFRPLHHLQTVTTRFGHGDSDARSRLEGDGELATLGSVFNDMHDRILADRAALSEQEALYRLITDHGHSLIWLSGPDGGMHYFNRQWLEFTGRTLAEESGSGWTQNLHPEDVAPCTEAFAHAHAERAFLSQLCRLRRHDGTFRWILLEGTPRFDAAGAFLGHVGHCLDITELKQAEEELQDERERLEISVTHRTRELVLARDAAQAANRAKSIFLANMSHEMRTPLNTIIGTTELVRGTLANEVQRGQLLRVTQASRHLLGIIDDVVDMARLETEQLTLHLDRLVLGDVVGAVTAMVETDMAAKSLALRTDIDEGLRARAFNGDERRLAQVLVEVLGNAIKFTDRGSITLRVAVVEESAATSLLRFEVEDTGPGITPEDMGRLFAAFEQMDGSTTRRHTGLGLGLALGRRLVQLMGGDMGAMSTPGAGSTFWFTVKMAPAAASDAPARTPGTESALRAEESARETGGAQPASGPVRSFDEVCEELSTLLGQWNFEASALLATHAELLSRGLGPHYHAISVALADYDFATAREKLAAARTGQGTVAG